MERHQDRKRGHRTLRFESCEARRVLSAQTIDLGLFAPLSGENTLIFSTGIATGWTPIDGDSRLTSLHQFAGSRQSNDVITLYTRGYHGELAAFDGDAFSDRLRFGFSGSLNTDALDDHFETLVAPTVDANPISEPPTPIGPADRGAEYGVTPPVLNHSVEDDAERAFDPPEPDATPLPRGLPAPSARPLERVSMTPRSAGQAANGSGLIDLTALLIERPTRTPVATASADPPARPDAPARDAAFAIESWVRALPHAAVTPQIEPNTDLQERAAIDQRLPSGDTAPTPIDPTSPDESAAGSERASASVDRPVPGARPLDEEREVVAGGWFERSAAYRFVATGLSLMTVGGLVRAVRDEPVRREPRPKRR